MPLELKYLAVIESALILLPTPARGKRPVAVHVWDGKVYGLKISSYTDDRFDPVKSTVAACQHLTDLYEIYGNWSLALAAYNSGAGMSTKPSGGRRSQELLGHQKYLPRETRSYVPAFIAASYVMTYASEHRISLLTRNSFYEIDTVTVKNPLTFDQISEMLKIRMKKSSS